MFNVERLGPVPHRKTILQWIEAFRITGSAMKRKPPCLPHLTRRLDDVETVRMVLFSSLWVCPVDRCVPHDDSKFHPDKMIVQQLTKKAFAQCREF